MIHPNVAVVSKMYECFGKGDMETLRKQIFSPDLVWNLPGHHPLAGIKQGADEVIAFFGQLAKTGIKVDLIAIDAIDEDTVVELHRGYGSAQGEVLDAMNCTHYQISDGKIANVQVYIGDQHPVDIFFWATYDLKPIPARLAN